MSKFFEALERAERQQALPTRVALPRTTADGSPPPTAPSGEAEVAAPPLPAGPVAWAPATAVAGDRASRGQERLVSLFDSTSFEADQYRVLRQVVETLRKGANLQVVAVTSAAVGEGKTTTAINLAGALAQSTDARVLVADMDVRRPSVARALGLGGSRRGLVDALLDASLTLEDTVERLAHFNLAVLPAGRTAVAPYELLKSPRLEALLAEARQRYDFIVLDTPPFVPVPDCRLLAKCVDGFLIVVMANRTPRGMLAEMLDLMDSVKVVGLLFNGANARRSSYYDVYAGPSRGARLRRAWGKP